MQLGKESLKKFQACCDLNLDLCDTGAALLKSGTTLCCIIMSAKNVWSV